jgi:hypothetical protein
MADGDREKFTRPNNSEGKVEEDNADKFAIFEKWLVDNGTKFPKLELKDYGDEVRGCHTLESIEEV